MIDGFGDKAEVPDGAWFGQLRVYRQWAYGDQFVGMSARMLTALYGYGFESVAGQLTGVTYRQPWRDGWSEAVCRHYTGPLAYGESREDPVPHDDCGCGYWGYWRPNGHAFRNFGDHLVFGVAEIGGRVRVGPLGVRAERARVLAVVAPPKVREVIRRHYPDVEFFGGRQSLLRAYPPQDVNGLIGVSAEKALHDHELARWRREKQYWRERGQEYGRRLRHCEGAASTSDSLTISIAQFAARQLSAPVQHLPQSPTLFTSSSFAAARTSWSKSASTTTLPAFTFSLGQADKGAAPIQQLLDEINKVSPVRKATWWRRAWGRARGWLR